MPLGGLGVLGVLGVLDNTLYCAATASSRSLKGLLQVKPNKEVFSFLSSHQNITRRAAAVQMFPHRVSLKFKLKIFG